MELFHCAGPQLWGCIEKYTESRMLILYAWRHEFPACFGYPLNMSSGEIVTCAVKRSELSYLSVLFRYECKRVPKTKRGLLFSISWLVWYWFDSNRSRNINKCANINRSLSLNFRLVLANHLSVIHGEGVQVCRAGPKDIHYCKLCGEEFKRQERLIEHCKTLHPGSNVLECECEVSIYHWDSK